MINVSSMLVWMSPYLKPLVIHVIRMLLTLLANEAKSGQLATSLGEWHDEVEAIALALIRLIDGEEISPVFQAYNEKEPKTIQAS